MGNPIVRLELMRRFRSPLAAWGIPIMVLLPGLAVALVYWNSTTTPSVDVFGSNDGFQVEQLRNIGVGMFAAVLATMLVALLLIVPSMVGGAIAGERQNQTLQPLQLTELTPTGIVVGKMTSSVAYLLVLLGCAAPVMAIPFLLGGLTATQVLGAYAILVLITVQYAAISLAVSSAMRRPGPAIMLSLVTCAFLTVAPWVAMGIGFMMASRSDPGFAADLSPVRYLASPSPVTLGSWVPMGPEVDLVIRRGVRVARRGREPPGPRAGAAQGAGGRGGRGGGGAAGGRAGGRGRHRTGP
jgi:ABC-type transport system involved in multi-copper enzyme maturation permease subunit